MRFAAAILMSLFFHGISFAASPEEDVARYVQIFSGDKSLHSDAADTFAWLGLSDTRIFDIIERRLLEEHESAKSDRDEKNRVARYIRALGFSGQSKYAPTITRFFGSKAYERYASAAMEDLPQYQKWNLVISNRAAFDPRLSDDANRVMNMLRSDDLLLQEVGAKRIYFRHQEDELLEMLAKDIRAHYSTVDPQYSDAVSWMLKALGNARKEKYRPLLEEALANARDRKVRKYAQLALDYYNK
jgi:hypothetical protein